MLKKKIVSSIPTLSSLPISPQGLRSALFHRQTFLLPSSIRQLSVISVWSCRLRTPGRRLPPPAPTTRAVLLVPLNTPKAASLSKLSLYSLRMKIFLKKLKGTNFEIEVKPADALLFLRMTMTGERICYSSLIISMRMAFVYSPSMEKEALSSYRLHGEVLKTMLRPRDGDDHPFEYSGSMRRKRLMFVREISSEDMGLIKEMQWVFRFPFKKIRRLIGNKRCFFVLVIRLFLIFAYALMFRAESKGNKRCLISS